MRFRELVAQRRSVRAFQPDAVDPSLIEAVLSHAALAPSAGNIQSWQAAVVTRRDLREALARAAEGQSFVASAPAVIVFFQDPARGEPTYGSRARRLYALQDATIACAYAQLAATELGLASCWVGAFDEHAVAEALRAPPDLKPVALLPLGYAAESPVQRSRRDLSSLVHNEQWPPRAPAAATPPAPTLARRRDAARRVVPAGTGLSGLRR